MNNTSQISRKETVIAIGAIVGIIVHLVLRSLGYPEDIQRIPTISVVVLGGAPLVYELIRKLLRLEFGSDLLAGISIVTSLLLDEYLAGSLVVLMLSGGEALEQYAVRKASSVLEALSKRVPYVAHVRKDSKLVDVSLNDVKIGDTIVIYPHEIAPVDGEVISGHGSMDESYLTGEPFHISKTPGSSVISGAINGESAITISATKLAIDSRYAKIVEVMKRAETNRPEIRRLGDQLGALYTPVAVVIAIMAWFFSGDPTRFLSVIVVATPCPLLIAIPVAIIGSISLCAKRGIIIKNPSILEQLDRCNTMIFDKTGTLTYGEPKLSDQYVADGISKTELLTLAASIERYSKHPLSEPILREAKAQGITLIDASGISERPGQGLTGVISGKRIEVTSRNKAVSRGVIAAEKLPAQSSGLECVILIDDKYAGIYRFHDSPRKESTPFVQHLGSKHQINRLILLSGDRESEVKYLADLVGITQVYHSKSPEEKVSIVREETAKAKTLFIGDGINDAPALMTATVGVALGQASDITSEAAGAVIMDASLSKVDELLHIGARMKSIALQSAWGGMLASIIGMIFAALGVLTPVAGALTQEIIDLFAVLNALRAAARPTVLTDFGREP